MWQSYPPRHATLLLSLSLISSLLLSLSRPRSITASGCNNYKIFNRIIKAAGTRAKGQSRRRYLPTYLAPGNGPCDNVNQRQTQTTTATTREWDREGERGRATVRAAYRANFSRTPSKQFATGYPNGGPLFAWFRIPCRQRVKGSARGGAVECCWVCPCAIKNLFLPYLTQFNRVFYVAQSHKLIMIVSWKWNSHVSLAYFKLSGSSF